MQYFFIAWYLVPPFLFVEFSQSSYAAGLAFLAVIFLTFILFTNKPLYLSSVFRYIIVISSISTVITFIFSVQSDPSRQLMSVSLLLLIGACITSALRHYLRRSPVIVGRNFKRVYWLIVLLGLISVIHPLQYDSYRYLVKPVFPFPEPSHFALSYISAAGLAFPFCSKNQRILIVCLALFFGFIFPNLTMLLGGIMFYLLIARSKLVLILFVCIISISVSFVVNDLEIFRYILERVSSEGDGNLSRIVYIRGWESILQALTNKFGLGVGFQELGNQIDIDSTLVIRDLAGGIALNERDGGFLFSKLVSEFGYIGLVFGLLYLYISIKSYFTIRRVIYTSMTPEVSLGLIPYILAYLSLVEIFIRGIGYFSPSIILMIALVPNCFNGLRGRKMVFRSFFTFNSQSRSLFK